MIEKLKKLPFISLKEVDDVDKRVITYIDDNNPEQGYPNVWTQTISCGTFSFGDIDEIPYQIESEFIYMVKELKETHTISIPFTDNDSVNEVIIASTVREFVDKGIQDKLKQSYNKETDIFVLVPDNMVGKLPSLETKCNVVYSSFLTDEVIFGYKTKVDHPGIVLVSNEDNLKDIENIRYGLFELGFFPGKSYNIIKIINII